MELRLRARDKILRLQDKGVDIPNPLSLDIGEEVDPEGISGQGVKIYPGCRIYGAQTVIAAGARLGQEGPVTIENCQIGPKVELKGGYFKESVFLEGANMGLGAHVREGCILEEEAGGAHCVGLKQTILFPFVTLGSLINFCDCLMAGGTSRQDHSEVGSSYIHFNFTPSGDKTTASLIGDVPRGVMLNQRPIFLGGQGGMVGPLSLGFGNVVAAGTILRQDVMEENKLIVGKTHAGTIVHYNPYAYPGLPRIVENNFLYLANLTALQEWYHFIRRPFLSTQEFGEAICSGLLAQVNAAKKERVKRLKAMAERIPDEAAGPNPPGSLGRRELRDRIEEACEIFTGTGLTEAAAEHRDRFLTLISGHLKGTDGKYVDLIRRLPAAVSKEGTQWLNQIILGACGRVAATLPSLRVFKRASL